jgi:hypothetical protein
MRNEAWRQLLRTFIAYDIPDDMEACFDCEVVCCPNERFATCPVRLVRAAAPTDEPDKG